MNLERLIGKDNVLLVAPSLMIDRTIHWTRAVNLVLFREGYTVLERDEILRSPSLELNKPLVVAHGANYSRRDRTYRPDEIASKRTIRMRDDYTCQYCGEFGDTIDHIVPRAMGGRSVWGNMCVSCRACNFRKGSKTLNQIGYKAPVIPNHVPYRVSPLQEALFKTLEMSV